MIRRWRSAWVVGMAIGMVGSPLPGWAQSSGSAEDEDTIVLGHRANIQSEVLNEDRPLLIYTPPGYGESTEAFPVLYLLDGDSHFHHASGVTQFLSANMRMPAMIVVGVPNLTQEGRTRDLTPPLTIADTADTFPTAGGGSDFRRFLTDELRPWVESHYRTQPYSVLVGHSFGGLFVTQVLMEDPEAFEAYISISPSLWWDDQRFVDGATSIFEDHPDLDGSLYMTMGNEGGTMLAGGWALTSILETSAPESFRWEWKHMPAETHGSVPHRSLYDGLEWVFDGWAMPNAVELALAEGGEGWSEIRAHYTDLTERFGIEVQVPADLVDGVGRYMLRQKRIADAIRALEVGTELYPNSASAFDSLGDAYDTACRWEEASASYATAYQLAQGQSHPELDTFKTSLDEMTAKIESGEECTVPGTAG